MKSKKQNTTSPFYSSTASTVDPYLATLDFAEVSDTWEASWEALDSRDLSGEFLLELSEDEPTLNQDPALNRYADDFIPYSDEFPTLVDDFDPPTLVETPIDLGLSSKTVDLPKLEWKEGWKPVIENRITLTDL